MSKGLLFWLLMVLWAIFGVWVRRGGEQFAAVGNDILLFILLFVLGWAVFGFVVQ
jgi:hypothetical protein